MVWGYKHLKERFESLGEIQPGELRKTAVKNQNKPAREIKKKVVKVRCTQVTQERRVEEQMHLREKLHAR